MKTKFTQKQSIEKLPIPTREEFHREFGGTLTSADFSTQRPNPNHISRVAYSVSFSKQTGRGCLHN